MTERHSLDSALTSASDVKVHAAEDSTSHGTNKYIFHRGKYVFGSVTERHPLDSALTVATI